MDDVFNLYLLWTCHLNSFVATKDKFTVLHLPDLINGVQFHKPVLLNSFSWNQRKILTCNINALPHHQVALSNPKCFLCCCFVVDFLIRFLFINKTCFSRYSINIRFMTIGVHRYYMWLTCSKCHWNRRWNQLFLQNATCSQETLWWILLRISPIKDKTVLILVVK